MTTAPLAHIAFGEDTGDIRHPILILHGLFGSARNWSTLARALSEDGHRVVALDLPNHGQSPWTEGATDYSAMARAVEDWMTTHKIERSVILGHSMGGKTAMTLALSRPERVEALVVVDISPVPYSGREHRGFIQAMRSVDPSVFTRRAEVEEKLRPAIAPETIRRFLMQNLEPSTEGNGLRWRLNLAALEESLDALMDFPLPEDMEPFFGPALFLAGGASDYVLPEHDPVLARLFPEHRKETIPGTGHWMHAEKPNETLAAIRRFLDDEML